VDDPLAGWSEEEKMRELDRIEKILLGVKKS
jgi:hypothetical protein